MERHPDSEIVTASALGEWALPEPTGRKHSRGQLVVVGGSAKTPGAVMLAGLAALRVGAGVLALAVCKSTAAATAVAVPEAGVVGLPELDGQPSDDALDGVLASADAILVGPGLDDPEETERLLERVVSGAKGDARLVLDAFALGVLRNCGVRDEVRGRAVLTPNASEARRLLDAEVDDLHPSDVAVRIAAEFGAVVSFDGCIADADGRRWTAESGSVGLGTSGSGDVLAGAVVGFLARGATPAQAACWATYVHGMAGDRLAARIGRLGYLARELVDELPLVIVQTEA